MASEKKMNETTSFQHSETPILCANGCGFFGTPATMDLCSKCYRDRKLHEEQAAAAISAVEKSMGALPLPAAKVVSGVAHLDPAVAEPVAPVAGNRCGCCNKKVGVVGFKCRCGATFCGSHRYPEEHGCSFDFKAAGRDALANANPLVKADKVERF